MQTLGATSTATPDASSVPATSLSAGPRTEGIFVRVTPAERRLLQLYARYRGQSVAGNMRQAALQDARTALSEMLARVRGGAATERQRADETLGQA
jgi:hypothetical protein